MQSTLAEIITLHNLVTDKNSYHSYCDSFYEQEFSRYRDQPIQLVEIGIDQGGSLMLWAEYFKQGKILGVDLQLRGDCERNCSRYSNIWLSLGNAYMYESLRNFPNADIVIDDGPHNIESQIFAVKNFLPKVNPGGIFVIEDVANPAYLDQLHAAVPFHLKEYAESVDLRHVKGRYDDIMFVVRVPGKNSDVKRDPNVPTTRHANNISLLKNPTGLGMDMMAERLNHLTSVIDFNDIKTIIDIGAAHGYESLNLARVFEHARIYGFEPTPEHYAHCLKLFAEQPSNIRDRISVENLAVNDVDGPMKFYPLDETQAKSNNTGMASKFKLIDPLVFPHELNIQKEIVVNAVTLDTWCKNHNVKPDLIWIDAQGAELDIFKGAEQTLKNVQVVMTEAALKPYYHGHTMKSDIDVYLAKYGFLELVSARKHMHEYEVDTIYIRA